jgi:hypothetical protein
MGGSRVAGSPATRSSPVSRATRAAATAAPRQTRATGATRPKRASASRPPRRVSGPLLRSPAIAGGPSLSARAASIALPLRPTFGLRHRVPKPAKRPATIGERCKAFVTTLPDHHLLDRAVRGRAWIPLLGVLLVGIVAAQVEILKLGASMGRSLEQTSSMTTQNETLRASVASLSNDQRIESAAAGMGMVNPPPGSVGFLTAQPAGNADKALANLHSPDPSSFVSLTPTNGALVTGQGSSTLPSTEAPATLDIPSQGTTSAATSVTSSTSAATGSTESTGSQDTATQTTATQPTTTQDSTTGTGETATQPQAPAVAPETPTTQSETNSTTQSQTESSTQPQTPSSGAAAVAPSETSQQSTGG